VLPLRGKILPPEYCCYRYFAPPGHSSNQKINLSTPHWGAIPVEQRNNQTKK
jgi:hypothetical protein